MRTFHIFNSCFLSSNLASSISFAFFWVFQIAVFSTQAVAAVNREGVEVEAYDSESNKKSGSKSALECKPVKAEVDSWLDDAHSYLNSTFCSPAEWFDGFFSVDRYDDEVRPGSRVRWQHDFLREEGGGFEYSTKLRASFKLPKASDSLRLVFEGDQEENVEEVVPSDIEDTRSQVGFLYEFTKSPRANLSLKLSFSPKITLRYRYSLPITTSFTTKFTEELFNDDGVDGSSSQLDFIKSFSESLILRQTISFTHADDISGAEWLASLVLYQKLSDISALSYESSYVGVSDPRTYTTNVRLAIRYRRNFYRSWLFYEVVPEISWPRLLITDERESTGGILFRLEINFVNL